MARAFGRRRVIASDKDGPIKAVVTAQGGALGLLGTQRDRNNVLRQAMHAGGKFHVRVFLPKRFTSMSYARKLGYIHGRWKERMFKPTVITTAGEHRLTDLHPLVQTGDLARSALERNRVEARSTKAGKAGARLSVKVIFSREHGLKPSDARVLTTVADFELDRIAEVVEQEIISLIQADGTIPSGRRQSVTRRATGRAALRAA